MQNMKKKDRHIVTWSQEEDDILREQIRVHGTENWTIIASKFKDKTTRQCRRRWYTYLNSDFKKGGWSTEEDILLCEAQRIFGNRWTEIAKVVSGRTDNAVKNRFSTLCKKRAKHEALAKEFKENDTSYVNLNNKRIIFQNGLDTDGILETAVPLKKLRRNHVSDITKNCNGGEANQHLRPPFAVLDHNINHVRDFPTQHSANTTTEAFKDEGSCNVIQGIYLKKDDPKIIALMQQAELLSSLALKVNTENTDQSLENAWKVLQDFLNQNKENGMLRLKISDIDHQLENFKHLVEDLMSNSEGSLPSWRQPDLYEESQDSSEYSTGSTLAFHTPGDKTEESQVALCAIHQDFEAELQSTHIGEPHSLTEAENEILTGAPTSDVDILASCDKLKTDDGEICALPSIEFTSPLQVTPLFRSLAAGIPSPQFSESEKHFLLKTLGVESVPQNPSLKPSQSPPCKRVLLHSL